MASGGLLYAAILVMVLLVGGVVAGLYLTRGPPSQSTTTSGAGTVVQVVAAENFWGSLVTQLGGTHAHVLSIVSDPNADPHQYESSSANAQAVATANLVIINGAGYDTWAEKLISAAGGPHQTVLNVQDVIGLGGKSSLNPHFWYSPYYVNDTAKAIYEDLVASDPGDSAYFHQQYVALNSSLGAVDAKIHRIAAEFNGTHVAATEDIFVYLANATKLDLVSPPEFMQAVAEGNDPSASSIAEFQQLLSGGNRSVAVLVYNRQTVTPLTQQLQAIAVANHIPTSAITETIQPPDVTYQAWLTSELISLENALDAQTLGK